MQNAKAGYLHSGLLLSSAALVVAAHPASFPAFTAHSLGDSLAGIGTFQEVLSPLDLDGDGDLDFFSGEGSGGREFWFENRGAGVFTPHVVSDSNDADVGAAVVDVDGDGDMDRLAGSFLYRNPGDPHAGPWTAERTGEAAGVHDLLVGDIDGDGRPDYVTIHYPGIQWHRNPGMPGARWPTTEISSWDTVSQHGGIALGDFDGDGDPDVARINRWYENQDSGRRWVLRPGPDFGRYIPGFYGLSARTVVRDIDGDGDADLAQAECDIPNGRVAWFENVDRGTAWTMHLVKDSTDGQDFHSLALADFDGDGDLDFFSCGSMVSRGVPKWYVWENRDGKSRAFREHVILEGPPGGHEAAAFDADGDGDIDILGKEFNGYHLYLENRHKSGASIRPKVPHRGKHGRGLTFRSHPTPAFGGKGNSQVDAAGKLLQEPVPE
jgi:hypothetical protein